MMMQRIVLARWHELACPLLMPQTALGKSLDRKLCRSPHPLPPIPLPTPHFLSRQHNTVRADLGCTDVVRVVVEVLKDQAENGNRCRVHKGLPAWAVFSRRMRRDDGCLLVDDGGEDERVAVVVVGGGGVDRGIVKVLTKAAAG